MAIAAERLIVGDDGDHSNNEQYARDIPQGKRILVRHSPGRWATTTKSRYTPPMVPVAAIVMSVAA